MIGCIYSRVNDALGIAFLIFLLFFLLSVVSLFATGLFIFVLFKEGLFNVLFNILILFLKRRVQLLKKGSQPNRQIKSCQSDKCPADIVSDLCAGNEVSKCKAKQKAAKQSCLIEKLQNIKVPLIQGLVLDQVREVDQRKQNIQGYLEEGVPCEEDHRY